MNRVRPPVKLVLASASSRRAELLRQAGIPFTVVAGGVPEGDSTDAALPPGETVRRLALAKARAVARRRLSRRSSPLCWLASALKRFKSLRKFAPLPGWV